MRYNVGTFENFSDYKTGSHVHIRTLGTSPFVHLQKGKEETLGLDTKQNAI